MSATIKVVNKQKEALILAIKESEKNESERLARLSNITSASERTRWSTRFDEERQREQTKIQCLMQDYRLLQDKAEKRDIAQFLETRKAIKMRQASAKSPFGENNVLPNRFVGLENLNDVLFLEDVTKKFEKHDRNFERRQNYEPYNPVQEERKLRLLNQKRELLQRLVTVQTAVENGGVALPPMSSQPAARRRPFDVQSMTSDSSSLSYATFASSRPAVNLPRHGNINNNMAARRVPRLNLGKGSS